MVVLAARVPIGNWYVAEASVAKFCLMNAVMPVPATAEEPTLKETVQSIRYTPPTGTAKMPVLVSNAALPRTFPSATKL